VKNLDNSYIAHVRLNDEGQWIIHDLLDHLNGVEGFAVEFSKSFGGQDWASIASLWHDLGKYRPAFQKYIRNASGFDCEAHIENSPGRVDHSTTGAVHAVEQLAVKELPDFGRILAYLIAGHHAGLPDWNTPEQANAALSNRIAKVKQEKHLEEILSVVPDDILGKTLSPGKIPGGPSGLHLWLRMLFSCLVDADFLDTERFMSPEKNEIRSSWPAIQELKSRFDAYMTEKSQSAPDTMVNRIRAGILEDCRKAAMNDPGVFTLTVPTGGGKTLSGMAFALDHAIKFQKQRIIVVIPYTSIIEQTADQYRSIFGDAVVEHHSNLEPAEGKENAKSRLATENWDAPIIVTTNVQFFESLFAAKTSRCRKLHNICNSVVIIDEAQMFPPDYLQPVLDILRLLVNHYGVSLVLSTATQPLIESAKDPFGRTQLSGLDNSREIISDVGALYKSLQRVQTIKPADMNHRRTWEDLAHEICTHESALVIVNSRKDCRDLFRLMPEGTIHLSALMCGKHRSVVIKQIKELLKERKPVRVISTQLVEAGVDLDFPVVYRALAGLDSIAQAAGRCNREGKLEKGLVYVFIPPNAPPKGMLTFAEQATRNVWHAVEGDPLAHDLYEDFFRYYFSAENSDKHGVMPLLVKDAGSLQIQFRSAAEKFKLIDDKNTQQVIVPYGDEGERLIGMLESGVAERFLLRKVQRFSVTVYEQEFRKLQEIGAIKQVSLALDLWAVCVTNAYDNELGLLPTEVLYCGTAGIM
jgi:CRISPR-associated endonuclease/helicase Cas3